MPLKKKPSPKIYHELIEKTDFSTTRLAAEYESVEFRSCNFADISGVNFTDCQFTACNMSNASLAKCKMQDIRFADCKLIGINFYETHDFGFAVYFENCLLDFASFDHKKMNQSSFTGCRLHGVNFTQTDLSKATMANCDFLDAVFANTNLSSVDFTTNRNFIIDPQLNLVKKAKFSSTALAGLLTRFDLIIE